MKKTLVVIFSIMFVLSLANMASALTWQDTNSVSSVYIDLSGSIPIQWYDLTLPSWYNASEVTLFEITVDGHGFYPGAPIDVWLSKYSDGSSPIEVASFTPSSDPFSMTWEIPITITAVNLTYFTGLSDFYIGYACHFYLDSSGDYITQPDNTGQTPTPEPTTLLLLGSGLLGLWGARKKFRK